MEQLRSVHEQRATAILSSGAVTAEALQPMVAQEETLRAQLDTIRLNTELQIRALLTPEQLAQAAATHAKLESLHEQEHAVVSAAHSTEQ
jgi:Spy/CpxP family protein refolding chaperone